MKTIGVLTSGGDAPGMNAAIRAVVRNGIYNNCKVYGIEQGYEGLINARLKEMTLSSVADIIHRGGTFLRTARSEEFRTENGLKKAKNVLDVFGIEGLVVIGGDGSIAGAQKLNEIGITAIGVPGTIDNDLEYTDHSIGFDTAINTVVEAISKIRDTSSSHGRVNIVEVMGRHCGDIALYCGLAGGAESIILPEIPNSVDSVCQKIIRGKNRGKLHSLILMAEGAGSAVEIAKEIEEKTSMETRATILGHIQRGGNPTAFDRILASKLGAKAVDLILEGKKGLTVGMKCNEVVAIEIEKALAMKKKLDMETYDLAGILSI
ncbi:6-phosphofructokinase [Tindallia californiensis]|uniref:ATP-dependent 6-phosphofructokinase n=1 Tax=Tindallia californiensis TaxID=159292 RepID=A0A1H3K079_9FIRM|nr:6-phosphofructokinase [Tindallia californiensis]SDY45620.1 6-phosphofructokinase [Tindallia californiensis]